jgi:hypothetical protein
VRSRIGGLGIEVGHDVGEQRPFIGTAGPNEFLFGEIYKRGVPICGAAYLDMALRD